MISPRWRKILRDVAGNKARTTLLVLALSAGNLGLATVLSAYGILNRELDRNYLETRPATATLTLDRVDAELVEKIRQRPGVDDAEARGSYLARVKVGDDWRPLLLFAVEDFQSMRIATIRSVGGAWPPPFGSMLLERTAERVLEAGIGDVVEVRAPGSAVQRLGISGIAHDPSLAPAWMERTGYAYVSRETFGMLGGTVDEVRVVLLSDSDAIVRDLAAWLAAEGRRVERICVPPPGRHPHQGMMTGLLVVLGSFSLLLLALGAVLVATVVGAVLAREVRAIGVMKAIGASTIQIATLYLAMIAGVAAVAFTISIVPGLYSARAYAGVLADLLNFTIASSRIPTWAFAIEAAVALLLPLGAALLPVWKASRIAVRTAIDDSGVRGSERFGLSFIRLNRVFLMAIRNVMRHRWRLLPTGALLALAGALTMSALNLAKGWKARAAEISTTQRYDVEFRLARPEPIEALLSRARKADGIRVAEAWGAAMAALSSSDGIAIERTYPDQGHGSLRVLAPPQGSELVRLPLVEGRWLADNDTDVAVIGSGGYGVGVGGVLTLSIEGRTFSRRVVGRVREVGPSTVYLPYRDFARATETEGKAAMLRIATTARTAQERSLAIREIDRALDTANVAGGLPLTELVAAIEAHVVIFILTLTLLAAIVGGVGLVSLASVMSIGVLERKQEFAILRAVGASPTLIRWVVMLEALIVAGASFIVAVVVSLPLFAGVREIFGRIMFGLPVPFAVSFEGIAIWAGVISAVTPLSVWAAGSRSASVKPNGTKRP